VQTYDALADALAAKEAADGMVVSGIWLEPNGRTRTELMQTVPDVFFLAPTEADDDTMRELSYEAQYGEPMPADEKRYLRALARKIRESK
jgi:hypothetical protein